MKFLILILALPAIIASSNVLSENTWWTFNSEGYFAELYPCVLQSIKSGPGLGVDSVVYSMPIQDNETTLSLYLSQVLQLENITYSPPEDNVYIYFPAATTVYTLGKTVIEYRVLISKNDSNLIPSAYATLELSDIKDDILLVTFNKTEGYYAEIMKTKISGMGQLVNIKLDGNPVEHLEIYIRELYEAYFSDISTEAATGLEFYMDQCVKQMNISKYIMENQ